MKIKGQKIEGANIEIIPIPRGNGRDDVIFMVEAILDMDPFYKTCPVPMPPLRKIKNVNTPQFNDENYLKAVRRHSELRLAWMAITALKATEGLEWETIDLDDPSTWLLFKTELKDSGFSDIEIMRITNGVVSVCNLNDAKIEEARERFLVFRQEQEDALSCQADELNSTLSGKPVEPSGSDPQE